MEASRLPIFRERFSALRGEMTQAQFADKLGISRATVGLYETGSRLPDALGIKNIAEKCGVSADYLIGLTDVRTSEADMRTMCEYTGLTEKALFNIKTASSLCLHNCTGQNIINDFINDFFPDLTYDLIEIWSSTQIAKAFLRAVQDSTSWNAVENVKKELEVLVFRLSRTCDAIPNSFDTYSVLEQLEDVYIEKRFVKGDVTDGKCKED